MLKGGNCGGPSCCSLQCLDNCSSKLHTTHKLLHVAHALTCQLEVTILQICMHGGTQALQDLGRLAASAIDGWRFDFSIM